MLNNNNYAHFNILGELYNYLLCLEMCAVEINTSIFILKSIRVDTPCIYYLSRVMCTCAIYPESVSGYTKMLIV